MEFEEYKSKLQMLRDSLNELRDYRSKRYNATCDYIRSVKTTEGKIQEQLNFLLKNYTDEENDLVEQLSFIDFLDDKGKYTELTKELIDILQGRQVIAPSNSVVVTSDMTGNLTRNNGSGQNHAKANLPKSYKEIRTNPAIEGNQAIDEPAREQENKHKQEEDETEAMYATFMKAYREGALGNSAQRLNVCDEVSRELMFICFGGWNDFANSNKITLVDTTKQPQYFAYDGADYIAGVRERGKYYLLVPTKSFDFNETQIVCNAMLAFFDLPGDGRDCLNGAKPRLVRPAVLKKEPTGEYTLCKDKQGKLYKGEYRL